MGASKYIDGEHHKVYVGTVENARTEGGVSSPDDFGRKLGVWQPCR